jgi:hypothetical protein
MNAHERSRGRVQARTNSSHDRTVYNIEFRRGRQVPSSVQANERRFLNGRWKRRFTLIRIFFWSPCCRPKAMITNGLETLQSFKSCDPPGDRRAQLVGLLRGPQELHRPVPQLRHRDRRADRGLPRLLRRSLLQPIRESPQLHLHWTGHIDALAGVASLIVGFRVPFAVAISVKRYSVGLEFS